MLKDLIYIYEMLLFIIPTLILVRISYYISILKTDSESLTGYFYYYLTALFCIADMYVYGCFFRLRNIYEYGDDTLLVSVQSIFLFFTFICIYYIKKTIRRKSGLNNSIIVEAVDEFPGGLSFSDKSGVPILVNKNMYRLIHEILNISFVDADVIWQALSDKAQNNKYRPKLLGKEKDLHEVYHRLKDGSAWCFKKSPISSNTQYYVQIEALDVSNLVKVADEINEDNEELKSQNKRIKLASLELEKLNRNKERYFTKVDLHSEFGEYILRLRQLLKRNSQTGISREDLRELSLRWYKAIDAIKGKSKAFESKEAEEELLKVASIIGCKIFFPYKRPYKGYESLYYRAVREALSNAVRHAHASELYIEIEEEKDYQKIKLFDNGSKKVELFSEGNGLSALRKLLEKEGAGLEFETKDVFKMIITFPYRQEVL